MGRLTRDPDIRYSQGDSSMATAKFSLAVDRRGAKDGQQSADFINCVCWGKQAEFVEKFLHKGTKIACVGHIITGSYTNKDGQKVYTTDVALDEIEFAESKNASQSQTQGGTDYKPNFGMSAPETSQFATPKHPQMPTDGFMNFPDGYEDGLPFGPVTR